MLRRSERRPRIPSHFQGFEVEDIPSHAKASEEDAQIRSSSLQTTTVVTRAGIKVRTFVFFFSFFFSGGPFPFLFFFFFFFSNSETRPFS